ncbi:unnamed protein product [Cuscuta europaea]|uniref:Uncharacterized protein n=1 Tax=Cuscuta europaea TaxID=41803 RepID=A0A9P0Z727_CUSEU|nr:unnamed protein product [Cuscuta europaea]
MSDLCVDKKVRAGIWQPYPHLRIFFRKFARLSQSSSSSMCLLCYIAIDSMTRPLLRHHRSLVSAAATILILLISTSPLQSSLLVIFHGCTSDRSVFLDAFPPMLDPPSWIGVDSDFGLWVSASSPLMDNLSDSR